MDAEDKEKLHLLRLLLEDQITSNEFKYLMKGYERQISLFKELNHGKNT